MSRRAMLPVLVCAVLAVAILAVAACGSSSGTTTTAVPTTVAPTTTSAAAVPTTGAGATGTSTALDDYKAKMFAWVTGVLQKLDTGSLDLANPANATPEQLSAISAFLDKARAALAQLKAITPSADAAAAHNQFVKGFDDLISATDAILTALQSKSLTDAAAALPKMAAAQQELQAAMTALGPIIGLTPPSS
jgi:hypothetical protein